MPKQHSLDRLAEELAEYIEEMSDFLAESMLEDGVAPFAAQLTEAQRLDYFVRLLWREDGTPNQEGRQQLVDTQGLDEYVRTFRWVEQRRNREMKRTTPERRTPQTAVTQEDY